MQTKAASILTLRPEGLYCPEGDFYIDPVRRVSRALITHGHADHARPGHEHVMATAETIAVMKVRYASRHAGTAQAVGYGETCTIGTVRVSFHPAGHVLGSAQVLVETTAGRIVVSGDYKRTPDPTCAAFQPVPCDVFITEATFGLPVFRHPPPAGETTRLLRSLDLFPGRAHFIGAYSLGKAQRLIAMLRQAGYTAPVWVDDATARLCDVYGQFGVDLGDWRSLRHAGPRDLAGSIVIAPPSARDRLFADAAEDPVTSFASGWMRVRRRALQGGGDLPLIISDHADWDELRMTAQEVAPTELWITHGDDTALAHWARQHGMQARPLALKGSGEDDDMQE